MPSRSVCSGLSSGNPARSTRSAGRPTAAGWPPTLDSTDSGSRGWLSRLGPGDGTGVPRTSPSPELATSIAYSRDGTGLATGGKEGIVRVFDAADGRERHAPCSPGVASSIGPGLQPRWPPALRRRLGAAESRSSTRTATPRPGDSPGWPVQTRCPDVRSAGGSPGDRLGVRSRAVPDLRRPGRWHRRQLERVASGDERPPLAPRGLRLQSRRRRLAAPTRR